jgi:hypothetical protein
MTNAVNAINTKTYPVQRQSGASAGKDILYDQERT